FSYVGFQPDTLSGYRIQTGRPLALSVKLQPMTTELEEVVIGYGTISRKDVTSSITTIKAEDMNVGVFASPAQMLQGEVPGLTISTTSSNPMTNPSICWRAASSLRSGESMAAQYVSAGVPAASMTWGAPADIETTCGLREAPAAASWGS